MAIVQTNANQRRFQDPLGMFVTPYVLDSYQHLNLGTTTYDIHDIVGDTISLTQDDPDKTEIPWEFGDDPLDTNVKAGAKNFTCQCLDFQDAILQTMFGCTTQNGATIFPTGYQDLYVYIRIDNEACLHLFRLPRLSLHLQHRHRVFLLFLLLCCLHSRL